MVVINYQLQLRPGTFEYAIHYLIEHKLDLTVFHPRYRNEDGGPESMSMGNDDSYDPETRHPGEISLSLVRSRVFLQAR